MTVNPEEKIPETYKGKIGRLLKEISKHGRMTAVKRELVNQLMGISEEDGYSTFYAQTGGYKISAIGESYLYDVSERKKGALEPFRGKRVRIICVGSGKQAARVFMVGKV